MTVRYKWRIGSIALSAGAWLFALAMIYPLLWLVSSSFKPTSDIFVQAHNLIPHTLHADNYAQGLKGFADITFVTFFKNSAIVTILSVIGTVASSALAAYAFARIRFPGVSLWFVCMMLTMMLPGEVLIIPQYLLFKELDWIDTHLPLIVPSFAGGAFFIFLMIQFMRGIPLDLDESARIDGCGRFGFFIRIMLPLIVPALVTAAIFKFYWTWDDYFSPFLYLNSQKLATVALAIKSMSNPTMETDWGAVFAMSVLSLIPVLAIFVGFQKYIVEGISTTGLKG
jgi:multiple sugar transport system permease protein